MFGGQFNRGRMVYIRRWYILMELEWLCYRGGH